MNILSIMLLQQEPALTTANWIILIVIQITFASAMILMIVKICSMLNPKENEPSKESTCKLISIMTFIAWIVIALIIWEVSKAQMLGIEVGAI